MPDKIEMHEKICGSLHNIYVTKNAAYGDSFGKTFTELGIVSAITRMSDKWNRLVTLAVKNVENKVLDEAVEDTLMDLANYAIMTLIELEAGYGDAKES